MSNATKVGKNGLSDVDVPQAAPVASRNKASSSRKTQHLLEETQTAKDLKVGLEPCVPDCCIRSDLTLDFDYFCHGEY